MSLFSALAKPGVCIINENLNLSALSPLKLGNILVYIFSLSLVIKSTIFLIHTSRNITAAPPAAMVI